jgi:glycosyltransferase involved in cell wall biosynthesis
MSAPKVSVILCSYNHAPFIAAAIQSVLDQTFTDFELIISDDASADDSVKIIQRFQDPRIRLIRHERNLGIVENFNRAVAQAHGTYIAQMGSDDLFRPDKLRRQVEVLDAKPDIAVVFTHVDIINRDGLPYRFHPLKHLKYHYNQDNHTRHEWLRIFFHKNCLSAPSAMLRKSAMDRVGLYDPRFLGLQDYDWWIRFCLAGYELHVIGEELTLYRRLKRSRSLSTPTFTNYNRGYFEHRKLLRNYLALASMAEFNRIFAKDIPNATDNLIPYYVALAALDTQTGHHRELALEILFDLLKDPETIQQLETQHGFTMHQYHRLTERNALGFPQSFADWLRQSVTPLVSPFIQHICYLIMPRSNRPIPRYLRWFTYNHT